MDGQQLATKFKRPDQIGGLVVMGLVAAGLLYGFWRALPTLIAFAQDTILFGVELAVLAVLAMFLLDPKFWHGLYFWSQNQIRTVRRKIVSEDPIGILDTVIVRFDTKTQEIADAMVQADAARKRQQNSIALMERKSQGEQALCETAQRMVKPDTEIQQHAVAAERWRKAADDMRPMAAMLDKMQLNLEQARDLCGARLDDLRNQREVLKIRLDTMVSSQAAVKRFKSFFGSNPDLEMQTMAVEEIERQSTEAEAEIDQFMRQISPLIQNADLQKQAEAQAALQRFGQFMQKPAAALPAGGVVDAVSVITVKETVKK